MDQYKRMGLFNRLTPPRGLVAGTVAAIAVAWTVSALEPGSSSTAPIVQSAIYLALLALTVANPRLKVKVVRTVQRWTINPVMRALVAIGLNPLGLAILETRGRRSGLPRRTPVGNGRKGESFWIIAEHGLRAGYVQNVRADPHVRVRLRVGLRYRWIPGIAAVLVDDDALARQRHIVAWHPLRALNAINVRVLGADLVVVHVRLDWFGKSDGAVKSTRTLESTEARKDVPVNN
ncbi:nitroreductase/quinone reductase family protein [Gordonia sp. (in: high G+C Gram-positive bacteria)]|uniref:nitroreductase/quinone reductase family protein n=1 Tax=Gordonia sp. (in: high G+C Gram-positive bacteria) TaxID=84139 RepID=UPI003F9D8C31